MGALRCPRGRGDWAPQALAICGWFALVAGLIAVSLFAVDWALHNKILLFMLCLAAGAWLAIVWAVRRDRAEQELCDAQMLSDSNQRTLEEED